MTQQGNSDDTLIFWSIGQIAERDGIGKPSVSRMVAKLVDAHGLPVQRDGRGRVAGVSLADYDHLRERFGNPEQGGIPTSGDMPASSIGGRGLNSPTSRDEALRQEAWIRVRKLKLEHAKDIGQLVRVDRLNEGLRIAGKTLQGEFARLEHYADELALAVSKEGAAGLRVALRKVGLEMNIRAADALEKVAGDLPEFDLPLDAELNPDTPMPTEIDDGQ